MVTVDEHTTLGAEGAQRMREGEAAGEVTQAERGSRAGPERYTDRIAHGEVRHLRALSSSASDIRGGQCAQAPQIRLDGGIERSRQRHGTEWMLVGASRVDRGLYRAACSSVRIRIVRSSPWLASSVRKSWAGERATQVTLGRRSRQRPRCRASLTMPTRATTRYRAAPMTKPSSPSKE